MPTLSWIGKEAVVNHHNQVPFRLLKRNNDLSVGEPDSGNLLVRGDNLKALKALLPYYAGQVKCIYIDPPYNTGNENWVYNDNVNSPEMKEWLGKVVGREGEDLSRSDKWLCMMYPRLILLKQFLKEDGAIFVSIDDDEGHYLKALMDEIYGRNNFVANIVWQKKYTRANDANYFSDNHDHIICYAKEKLKFKLGRVERTEQQDKAYKNRDNDPNGPWKPTPLHAKSGGESNREPYEFLNGVVWEPPPGTYRRFSDETMRRLDENGELWFGNDGKATPQRKTYLGTLQAGVTPVTLWLHQIAGDNHIGRDEVKQILSTEKILFDNPKPTTLLNLILQISTDKDSIILDSFAGSGTTGHAVLQLNKDDKGQRKFILVEMDHTVCEKITFPRLRNVITGYKYKKQNKEKNVDGLGSGFSFSGLGHTLFNAEGHIREEVSYSDLARHIYFCETGEPLPKITKNKSPLLGVHKGIAIYLLYNGILKDKTVNGGNVLTSPLLAELPAHDGQKVIYGNACRLSEKRLRSEQIIFRQTPYEIRIS